MRCRHRPPRCSSVPDAAASALDVTTARSFRVPGVRRSRGAPPLRTRAVGALALWTLFPVCALAVRPHKWCYKAFRTGSWVREGDRVVNCDQCVKLKPSGAAPGHRPECSCVDLRGSGKLGRSTGDSRSSRKLSHDVSANRAATHATTRSGNKLSLMSHSNSRGSTNAHACAAHVESARPLLLVHFDQKTAASHFLGLVNQFAELSHHIAAACEANADVGFSGFSPDLMLVGTRNFSLVPPTTMLLVRSLQRRLRYFPPCANTTILSPECTDAAVLLKQRPLTCSETTMPRGLSLVHSGRHILADQVLAFFEPTSPMAWAPAAGYAAAYSPLPSRYYALHLDLEADRVIYHALGNGVYFEWKQLGSHERAAFVRRQCARDANSSVTGFIMRALDMYADAIDTAFKHPPLPVVVATALGKGFIPGADATVWVLTEFLARMRRARVPVVVGQAASEMREIAAATELKTLSRAQGFVGSAASTFSRFAGTKVALRGHQSRLLKLRLLASTSPKPKPISGLHLNTEEKRQQGQEEQTVVASPATSAEGYGHELMMLVNISGLKVELTPDSVWLRREYAGESAMMPSHWARRASVRVSS